MGTMNESTVEVASLQNPFQTGGRFDSRRMRSPEAKSDSQQFLMELSGNCRDVHRPSTAVAVAAAGGSSGGNSSQGGSGSSLLSRRNVRALSPLMVASHQRPGTAGIKEQHFDDPNDHLSLDSASTPQAHDVYSATGHWERSSNHGAASHEIRTRSVCSSPAFAARSRELAAASDSSQIPPLARSGGSSSSGGGGGGGGSISDIESGARRVLGGRGSRSCSGSLQSPTRLSTSQGSIPIVRAASHLPVSSPRAAVPASPSNSLRKSPLSRGGYSGGDLIMEGSSWAGYVDGSPGEGWQNSRQQEGEAGRREEQDALWRQQQQPLQQQQQPPPPQQQQWQAGVEEEPQFQQHQNHQQHALPAEASLRSRVRGHRRRHSVDDVSSISSSLSTSQGETGTARSNASAKQSDLGGQMSEQASSNDAQPNSAGGKLMLPRISHFMTPSSPSGMRIAVHQSQATLHLRAPRTPSSGHKDSTAQSHSADAIPIPLRKLQQLQDHHSLSDSERSHSGSPRSHLLLAKPPLSPKVSLLSSQRSMSSITSSPSRSGDFSLGQSPPTGPSAQGSPASRALGVGDLKSGRGQRQESCLGPRGGSSDLGSVLSSGSDELRQMRLQPPSPASAALLQQVALILEREKEALEGERREHGVAMDVDEASQLSGLESAHRLTSSAASAPCAEAEGIAFLTPVSTGLRAATEAAGSGSSGTGGSCEGGEGVSAMDESDGQLTTPPASPLQVPVRPRHEGSSNRRRHQIDSAQLNAMLKSPHRTPTAADMLGPGTSVNSSSCSMHSSSSSTRLTAAAAGMPTAAVVVGSAEAAAAEAAAAAAVAAAAAAAGFSASSSTNVSPTGTWSVGIGARHKRRPSADFVLTDSSHGGGGSGLLQQQSMASLVKYASGQLSPTLLEALGQRNLGNYNLSKLDGDCLRRLLVAKEAENGPGQQTQETEVRKRHARTPSMDGFAKAAAEVAEDHQVMKVKRTTKGARNASSENVLMGMQQMLKGKTPLDYVLGAPYTDISKSFVLHRKEIGSGQFGIIRPCLELATGEVFACKSIPKVGIKSSEDADDIRKEVGCLQIMKDHPTIIRLKETFEDKKYVHIIMELCKGGDLFDRIKARGRLSEPNSARLIRTLVEALLHCHCKGIIHRDIKPENILMVESDNDYRIRLVDFGVATFFKPDVPCTEILGTPEYMAPEVLLQSYGPEADIWSAGVVLYIMMCGVPPFWASSKRSVEEAILNGDVSFKSTKWAIVSEPCKHLIKRMLVKNPRKRISALEILNHPWIRTYTS